MSLIEKLSTAATLTQWVDVSFLALVAFAACSLALAFGCRIRVLTLRANDPTVWAMNVAGGVLFAWIAFDTIAYSTIDQVRLAAMMFGACWIRLSLPTWAGGPPAYAKRIAP